MVGCGNICVWRFSSVVKRIVFCILYQVRLLVHYFQSIFQLHKYSNRNCQILEAVTDGKTKSQNFRTQRCLCYHTFSAGLAIWSHFQPVCFTSLERLSVWRKFEAVGNPCLTQNLSDPCSLVCSPPILLMQLWVHFQNSSPDTVMRDQVPGRVINLEGF